MFCTKTTTNCKHSFSIQLPNLLRNRIKDYFFDGPLKAFVASCLALLIIFRTKAGSHSSRTIDGLLSMTGKLCGIWPLLVKLLLARGTNDKPAASSQGAIGRYGRKDC